jgi:hypothetical protein
MRAFTLLSRQGLAVFFCSLRTKLSTGAKEPGEKTNGPCRCYSALAFGGFGRGFCAGHAAVQEKSRFLLVHRVGYTKCLILLMKSVIA